MITTIAGRYGDALVRSKRSMMFFHVSQAAMLKLQFTDLLELHRCLLGSVQTAECFCQGFHVQSLCYRSLVCNPVFAGEASRIIVVRIFDLAFRFEWVCFCTATALSHYLHLGLTVGRCYFLLLSACCVLLFLSVVFF